MKSNVSVSSVVSIVRIADPVAVELLPPPSTTCAAVRSPASINRSALAATLAKRHKAGSTRILITIVFVRRNIGHQKARCLRQLIGQWKEKNRPRQLTYRCYYPYTVMDLFRTRRIEFKSSEDSSRCEKSREIWSVVHRSRTDMNRDGQRNTVVLAGLRIAVGVLFVMFGQYKVFGTQFTLGGGFVGWIHSFLEQGAYPFMAPVLRGFVLTHARTIAFLVAYGELAIGVALVSGILVRTASLCGLIFML